MRQRQLRLVDRHVVIGDQIEIQRAWAPAPLGCPVAAEPVFNLVQREQQRMRVEAGLDFDAGIDEAVLLLIAPGRGGIVR